MLRILTIFTILVSSRKLGDDQPIPLGFPKTPGGLRPELLRRYLFFTQHDKLSLVGVIFVCLFLRLQCQAEAGRDDLVKRETDELSILEKYMPEQVSAEELEKIIKVDKRLLNGMDAKFAAVRAGRNLRAAYNIAPGKKIEYFFKPADAETAKFMQTECESMETLMRAEKLVIDTEFDSTSRMPSVVTDAGTLFIQLEGLIERAN